MKSGVTRISRYLCPALSLISATGSRPPAPHAEAARLKRFLREFPFLAAWACYLWAPSPICQEKFTTDPWLDVVFDGRRRVKCREIECW